MSTVIIITPHPNEKTALPEASSPVQTLVTGNYMTNAQVAALLRAAANELEPQT